MSLSVTVLLDESGSSTFTPAGIETEAVLTRSPVALEATVPLTEIVIVPPLDRAAPVKATLFPLLVFMPQLLAGVQFMLRPEMTEGISSTTLNLDIGSGPRLVTRIV